MQSKWSIIIIQDYLYILKSLILIIPNGNAMTSRQMLVLILKT